MVPRRLRALGRLRAGERNKTEAAYEAHLGERMSRGEILWHKFEGLKLRLADNTFYTADYAVMAADGVLELHEVKGSPRIFADDSRVKIKVAAALYPFRFKAVYPRAKREGGGWHVEEF